MRKGEICLSRVISGFFAVVHLAPPADADGSRRPFPFRNFLLFFQPHRSGVIRLGWTCLGKSIFHPFHLSEIRHQSQLSTKNLLFQLRNSAGFRFLRFQRTINIDLRLEMELSGSCFCVLCLSFLPFLSKFCSAFPVFPLGFHFCFHLSNHRLGFHWIRR